MAEAPRDDDELITNFTSLHMDLARLVLRADCFESEIDVNRLQAQVPMLQALSSDPLLLKLSGNAHAVVLRFGAVIFWNCTDKMCDVILDKIQQIPGMSQCGRQVQDKLIVQLGKPEDRVNFKDVWLKHLTLEHVKVVSQAFGQSVALKQYELAVAGAMQNAGPIVDELRLRGGFVQSARDLLKLVGFTLDVRATVLGKLTLFDDPAETQESERLSRLHALLHEHFDIKKRLSGLHAKLAFLADLNQMVIDLLQNKASHRLELIVIALIVIEVGLSIIGFFKGAP